MSSERTARHFVNPSPLSEDRRRLRAATTWERRFDCSALRPLIICRGPIRKEAIDVFREMGMSHIGMLVSERDSIVFEGGRAPELRHLDAECVHPVSDYSGADLAERRARIEEIIEIARNHNYDSIFAGYGFMAEDAELAAALERAGLIFIGPSAKISRRAGLKDEAKRTARAVDVSVTPGVDNTAQLSLLRKYPDRSALCALARKHRFDVDTGSDSDTATLAQQLLTAALARGIALFSLNELCAEAERQARGLFEQHPTYRLRVKTVGGGGGKGQRVLDAPGTVAQAARAAGAVPGAVREVLAEMKALGPGDNRNVLLELNIENTRHVEIQLIGNGSWCVSLGGRDCSIQAHEQKLLELSMTTQSLQREAAAAAVAGRNAEARSLRREGELLEQMENEAVRFGAAVGLDSVSTFECIVDAKNHFFMEMNTRIQVEHRVTELCSALEFCNPQDITEFFRVNSLVEAMALLAVHGDALPEPRRVSRADCAVEVRLNASNDALAPHAGGIIESWSPLAPGEIRDDQGISLPNRDSGHFVRYRLSGAYDSNIALLLCEADNRRALLERMDSILGRMELGGMDLATNLDFHRGLIAWLLGQNPNARPGNGFVQPWLAAVGELCQAAALIDLDHAWQLLRAARVEAAPAALREAWEASLDAKKILLLRALDTLFARPHLLAGWLGRSQQALHRRGGRAVELHNPLSQLSGLYRHLDLAPHPKRPASDQIWDHDQQLLDEGLEFYRDVAQRLHGSGADAVPYAELAAQLVADAAPKRIARSLWRELRAAHLGYQCGMELLHLPSAIGRSVGFYRMRCRADLSIALPSKWLDAELQAQMRRVLAPPPTQSGDEILAESGGSFYCREAPDRPPFIEPGQHFESGDTLCIIEVMKMFNKMRAPFAGTVRELLLSEDGSVVRKGQPLFSVQPDERVVVEDPRAKQQLRYARTERLMRRAVLS